MGYRWSYYGDLISLLLCAIQAFRFDSRRWAVALQRIRLFRLCGLRGNPWKENWTVLWPVDGKVMAGNREVLLLISTLNCNKNVPRTFTSQVFSTWKCFMKTQNRLNGSTGQEITNWNRTWSFSSVLHSASFPYGLDFIEDENVMLVFVMLQLHYCRS